jgi:hypothetical protein
MRALIEVDSTSNKIEFQDSWEVKRGWHIRLTTSPPPVSRMFRKYEIF